MEECSKQVVNYLRNKVDVCAVKITKNFVIFTAQTSTLFLK